MAYLIVWEFRVDPARCAEFDAAYGAAGPWADLFAKADGFVSVTLARSDEDPARYITIDNWLSRGAFDAFVRDFSGDYEALDSALEGIADSETRIGGFTTPG